MNVRPIRAEDDLTWALAEIAPYFERRPEPETADADRFDVLATLIEAYEARYHEVPPSDAAAVLRYAIADLGHSRDDLSTLVGSVEDASSLLSGDVGPTLPQILQISAAWRLPIEALLPKPAAAAA